MAQVVREYLGQKCRYCGKHFAKSRRRHAHEYRHRLKEEERKEAYLSSQTFLIVTAISTLTN